MRAELATRQAQKRFRIMLLRHIAELSGKGQRSQCAVKGARFQLFKCDLPRGDGTHSAEPQQDGVLCRGKALRPFAPPQPVRRFPRHADSFRRPADQSGEGKMGQKFRLPLRCPSVCTGAQRNGDKCGQTAEGLAGHRQG